MFSGKAKARSRIQASHCGRRCPIRVVMGPTPPNSALHSLRSERAVPSACWALIFRHVFRCTHTVTVCPLRTIGTGVPLERSVRIRVLTITITAPQQEHRIGAPSLTQAVNRPGANYRITCSKAIRRLQLGCRKPKLRARWSPFDSTCRNTSQRKSAPDSLLRTGRYRHFRRDRTLGGDVVFADDQMRARTDHAAHNLSVVPHFALNLIRYAPVEPKGGLKAQRLRAASSIAYREELLGLL